MKIKYDLSLEAARRDGVLLRPYQHEVVLQLIYSALSFADDIDERFDHLARALSESVRVGVGSPQHEDKTEIAFLDYLHLRESIPTGTANFQAVILYGIYFTWNSYSSESRSFLVEIFTDVCDSCLRFVRSTAYADNPASLRGMPARQELTARADAYLKYWQARFLIHYPTRRG